MRLTLRTLMRAGMLLPLALCACAGPSGNISFAESANGPQPFPTNYRGDLIAFMRTYLNDPVGVRGAALADPVQRDVGGHQRFVACLHYTAKDFNGRYTAQQERAVAFVDGRVDRVLETGTDACAGATYQPFPELEKMTR